MFGADPPETPASRRAGGQRGVERRAWRPEIPRAAAPLGAWVLAALLALPLFAAAIVAIG